MLKITLLEFFFRGIPESFLFIFSTYAFSKVAINKGRYVLSSMLFAIIIYTVRCLPIDYGMHTIFAFITLVLLSIFISKIEVIKAIKLGVFTIILVFICEGLNIIIILYVFGLKMNDAFSNNVTKLLYTSPSLIIFAVIVFTYYYILSKRKKLRVI